MYTDAVMNIAPLSSAFVRSRVEAFLSAQGLRLDSVETYITLNDPETDEILAGGGIEGDVIKCVAVSDKARGTGVSAKLVTELLRMETENSRDSAKVFTKADNVSIFESLGFRKIADGGEAVLLENGRGLERYLSYLKSVAGACSESRRGVMVINANPLTEGHVRLIEHAASMVERLFIIPVREERSRFPYSERRAMIDKACAGMDGVTVLEGSPYSISAATFPTYFLKDLSHAAEIQMRLDADLFARHIAPALGATVRFVGSEPLDPMTDRYNSILADTLAREGMSLQLIERFAKDGRPVSATEVRAAIDTGNVSRVLGVLPDASVPYVLAEACTAALRQELELKPKPGLVTPDSQGAHRDMDYKLMLRSIETLRPYFAEMALCRLTGPSGEPDAGELRAIAMDAEKAMLEATAGVNTHKGALFCLGLALAAKVISLHHGGELSTLITALAAQIPAAEDTHGAEVRRRFGVKGALTQALDGYPQLWHSWLPYYRSLENDSYRLHRTLLLIMSELEDSNIYYRKGPAIAAAVRSEAASMLEHFSIASLMDLGDTFVAKGISPGGAADMLALTIFINSII